MKRIPMLLILVLVAACQKTTPAGDTAGTSAEEHARMQAEQQAPSQSASVHLSPEQAQAIGVRYTTVTRGRLVRPVRTVGEIVASESSLADISARVEGYVERLYLDATGKSVRQGEPVLELYSPELLAAQQELLTALRLTGAVDSGDTGTVRRAADLHAAARRRLELWNVAPEQIDSIERTGQPRRTLTLLAPVSGVVLEKMVVAGQSVMPGMRLFRLADLSTVWIEGEVFEQDLPYVRVGTAVRIEFAAQPGETFLSRVGFVNPSVSSETRTGRVRVVVPNPAGRLRPGMYATLHLEAVISPSAVLVPSEAVVMTGVRNLVYVAGSDGQLEAREVTLGARGDGQIQILDGVTVGTRIVASANFLVDAESRLSTGGGMAGMPGMEPSPDTTSMPDMPGMPAEKTGKERRP